MFGNPSSMLHPFDLPLITDVIASFLTNKSLFQCIQVSFHFHQAFHPHLWYSIDLREADYRHLATFPAVARHVGLVHSLALHHIAPITYVEHFLALNFPHLHTLELSLCYVAGKEGHVLTARDMIDRHACLSLENLTFWGFPSDDPRTMLADIIRSYCEESRVVEEDESKPQQQQQLRPQQCYHSPRLRNLTVCNVSLNLENMNDRTREVFMNLESLIFHVVHIKPSRSPYLAANDFWESLFGPHAPPLPPPPPPPKTAKGKTDFQSSAWHMQDNKIQHLTVGSIRHLTREGIRSIDDKDLYQLVLESQNLTSVEWFYYWKESASHSLFAQDLRKGWGGDQRGPLLWPFLNCLRVRDSFVSDEILSEILLAMGPERPLRELDAGFTEFGSKCAKALLGISCDDDRDREPEAPTGDDNSVFSVQDGEESALVSAPMELQGHPVNHILGYPLEKLLVFGSKAKGSMIHKFLCTFPNLKEISGNHLADTDIQADPRPWVCNQQLRRLDVAFSLENIVVLARSVSDLTPTIATTTSVTETTTPSRVIHPCTSYNYQSANLMLDRLALLSGLRDFCQKVSWFPNGCHPFRLGLDLGDEGLEKIRSMSLLRRVKWGGNSPADPVHGLRIEDAKWMVANWPELDTVWVDRKITVEDTVAKWLWDREVHCKDSWDTL